MDTIDQKIRNLLALERMKAPERSVRAEGHTTEDFYRFIADEMEGAELTRMLEHLQNHPEDRELVAKARALAEGPEEAAAATVPAGLRRRVRGFARTRPAAVCPHCGKGITPFRRSPRIQKIIGGAWLLSACAAFALSFIVPRYFMQFLVLTFIFGVKWILDARAVRTQILIYKALRNEEEAGGRLKHLHRHDSPL